MPKEYAEGSKKMDDECINETEHKFLLQTISI